MKGLRIFLATFAITLTLGALAQDSVTPSRLRLLSLGVGVQAPSTNGDIRATRIGLNTAPAGAAGTLTATAASISGTATVGTLTATSGTIGGSNICTAANGQCPQSIPTPSTYTGVNSSTVGPLTFNSGNFTAGVTGCTTGTGPLVVWSRRGWEVEIQFQRFECTSNGLLFRLTGFPAEIRTGSNGVEMMVPGGNNGVQKSTISCHMTSSGNLECSQDGTAWTGSGQKWLGNVTNGTSVGLKYSLAW